MSLLGVGMRFIRIWTPDKSGSHAPNCSLNAANVQSSLEDDQGLQTCVGQSCAERCKKKDRAGG